MKSATAEAPTPYRIVALDKLVPNEWNPNRVEKPMMVKLKAGMQDLLDSGSALPPIVARKHPSMKGHYQIIDGYHRWLTMKELKQDTMPVVVIKADDPTSKKLTSTLNYLRGQADQAKYSEMLADLVTNDHLSVEELASRLPETDDEIRDLLEVSESGLDALRLLEDMDRHEKKNREEDADSFVDIKFTVSVSQAAVIERELDRIGEVLEGKNRRGRSLEFIAVLSSQTPMESIEPSLKGIEEGRDKAMKAKRKAFKLKRAQRLAKEEAELGD